MFFKTIAHSAHVSLVVVLVVCVYAPRMYVALPLAMFWGFFVLLFVSQLLSSCCGLPGWLWVVLGCLWTMGGGNTK